MCKSMRAYMFKLIFPFLCRCKWAFLNAANSFNTYTLNYADCVGLRGPLVPDYGVSSPFCSVK